jgi:hypothetical protein
MGCDAAEMIAGEPYDLQLRAQSLHEMAAVLGGVIYDRDIQRFWKILGQHPEIVLDALYRPAIEQ